MPRNRQWKRGAATAAQRNWNDRPAGPQVAAPPPKRSWWLDTQTREAFTEKAQVESLRMKTTPPFTFRIPQP